MNLHLLSLNDFVLNEYSFKSNISQNGIGGGKIRTLFCSQNPLKIFDYESKLWAKIYLVNKIYISLIQYLHKRSKSCPVFSGLISVIV